VKEKSMSLIELQSKLSEFIKQYSIKNFESEDIVELITEGESIDWIVDQLKGDAQIDVAAITSLLTEIHSFIKPETKPTEIEAAAGSVIESGMPDVSRIDMSQLDLAQIGDMLPEGVEMPPGIDAKQLKSLIESPQGQIMADFIVFCQEQGIDLSGGTMNDPRTERLQKEWLSTPRGAFDGKTPTEMLSGMQGKVETFRREEPRVGRNDPCPCGSGKKFKKCCGRS
jgi:hypothetical protein